MWCLSLAETSDQLLVYACSRITVSPLPFISLRNHTWKLKSIGQCMHFKCATVLVQVCWLKYYATKLYRSRNIVKLLMILSRLELNIIITCFFIVFVVWHTLKQALCWLNGHSWLQRKWGLAERCILFLDIGVNFLPKSGGTIISSPLPLSGPSCHFEVPNPAMGLQSAVCCQVWSGEVRLIRSISVIFARDWWRHLAQR